MSSSFNSIFARRNVVDPENMEVEDDYSDNSRTINLMISALALLFFGLVLATCMIYVRRIRQQRQILRNGGMLPTYTDSTGGGGAFTIQTTDRHGRSSVLVIGRDGRPVPVASTAATPMLSNPQQPPHDKDNAPEIRITFPDEQDESAGRNGTTRGRVVVVRMGEGAAVGLEPLREEQLPAYYEKEGAAAGTGGGGGGFVSIDMDQIGGLKEKKRDEYR